jgi:hypothetical protein
MITSEQREHIGKSVLVMQIIVAALAAGVVTFAVVVLVLRSQQEANAPQDNSLLLSYIGILVSASAIAAWMIIPRLLVSRTRQAISEGKTPMLDDYHEPALTEGAQQIQPLVAMHQTRLIVGCALLEGAAFLNLLAYMLEGQLMNLVAAGLLVLIIVTQIPTFGRLTSWIEDDLSAIDRTRSMR